MDEIKNNIYPLLPLRGMTIFPHMVLHFDVGRTKSILALEEAMVKDQMIFLVAQKDVKEENPREDDIYRIGCVSKIKQILKLPGDMIRVLVEGLYRAEIEEITKEEPYFECRLYIHTEKENEKTVEVEALMRQAISHFEEYVNQSNSIPDEILSTITDIKEPGKLSDVITSYLIISLEQRQELLEAVDPVLRLKKLIEIMFREIDILKMEKKIGMKVKRKIDKMQKEYYLREQLKVIQEELGDRDSIEAEVEEYKNKINKAKLPKEAKDKALYELSRYEKLTVGSPEGGIIRTYLDWLVELPWAKETKDIDDIGKVREVLEKEHYGLEDVKQRILEYFAVRKLNKSMKGPILCLVGPPGVGKTSIARSIANAMNRKFVRMSLGGVRDEAEIRGHRRTYIGAIPGRIIYNIKLAGTKNPVFLFDEIDKMSSDFRGDPADALLEVLDAEQNHSFRDHYLEIPFDLSKVLFITTANTTDTIPRPLLDRMEIIQISGYTDEEKFNICTRYLIPRQIKENGLKEDNISLSDKAVKDVISFYTRESGVRNLERKIGTICRKAAMEIVENPNKTVKINQSNLQKYLGVPRYKYEEKAKKDQIGVVMGLAWTAYGGDTLPVEVVPMAGNGKLELTGQLGDVMKESAKAGYSYIRANASKFGIDEEFYKNTDIHIHVPEGAVPKDGPSAGVTMVTAMVSALSKKPVRSDIAMTGEITLTGRVLAIGGVKEKSLSAYRAGITNIILPAENKKDIEKIPENIKKKIKFIFAERIEEVLDAALKGEEK
ncbi:ATP-dependent proteinase. Serine peptidase. MEROPS family S16 [Caloramator quimbayensis]|uniref:Lon protease n=1 Tax=Caloramator quimbayensis TaxID=1147123 RepID=A0A1T4XKU2_9CLOT|nr:endopeptidase La [Caloramator quimbayensis]SKA90124.1 ATP-dependent proteinase. Serine peptidase. MEROPS family S16 [Caloramator quimbayensis]